MKLSNYRYNRIGGIDADRELESGEIVPYTLSKEEIESLGDVTIAEYKKPPPDEKELKLSAYDFKGVTCSVCESDQNGWEVVGRRIQTLLDRGEDFRILPFFMENGNHVLLESHDEWLEFVDKGWTARESILLRRLQNG